MIRRVFLPVFRSEDYSPEALARRWLFYTQGPDGFKQGLRLHVPDRGAMQLFSHAKHSPRGPAQKPT